MRAPQLQAKAARILEKVERCPVAIEGDLGSGRATLMAQLVAQTNEDTVLVDLLSPDETDSTAAPLLQLSAALNSWPPLANASVAGLREYAGLLAGQLHPDTLLVLSVPSRLTDPTRRSLSDNSERAHAVLEGLRKHKRRVEVGGRGLATSFSSETLIEERLASHMIQVDETTEADWGTYGPAFDSLVTAGLPRRVSPLLLRLAVGAVGLGAPVAVVAPTFQLPAYAAIARLMDEVARRARAWPALTVAVQRFAIIRRPLPSATLLAAIGAPTEHHSLFTTCLGYGDPVRVPDVVRMHLVRATRLDATPAARDDGARDHAELAAVYRALDGVADPKLARLESIQAWIEKVHHLAHGGEATRSEWQQQTHPLPSSWWDRARAESLAGRFQSAADLYAECAERFPNDDYAHHYYAYNLARAKGSWSEVCRAYQRAIDLAPANVWWNRRFVCALADHDPAASRSEWREAVSRVDPSGERSLESGWLRENLQYPVAQKWWNQGRADQALLVLDGLPASDAEAPLATALHRQLAAEQDRWAAYLENGLAADGVPSDVVERVRAMWAWLNDTWPRSVPLPMSGAHEDGGAELAWRLRGWYVRLEFLADTEPSSSDHESPEHDDTWSVISASGDVHGGELTAPYDDFRQAFGEFLERV